MNRLKAVRHLVLAELAIIADGLKVRGKKSSGVAVEALAQRIEFIADRVSKSGPAGRPAIRIIVTADAAGGVEHADVVVADDFELYMRLAESSGPTAGIRQRNQVRTRAALEPLFQSQPSLADVWAQTNPATLTSEPAQQTRSWNRAAEATGVAFLMAAGFALSLWQSTRQFNSLDFGFLLENCHRILSGEVPYRDFWLCLPPAHYYLQSMLLAMCGSEVYPFLVVNCVMQSLAVLLTYTIVQKFFVGTLLRLIVTSPAALNGMAVISQPVYDIDATLFYLAGLTALLLAETRTRPSLAMLVAGIGFALVALTKWNMGLPVWLGVGLLAVGSALLYPRIPSRAWVMLALGGVATLFTFFAYFAAYGAIGDLFFQTLTVPSQNRLAFWSNLRKSLSLQPHGISPVTPHFFTWQILLLSGCVLAPISWFTGTHRRPFVLFSIVPTMGLILGAMQSQQDGSTYAIYPAASIVLASWVRFLQPVLRPGKVMALIGTFAAIFVTTGIVEISANTRNVFLSSPLQDTRPVELANLRGLSWSRPGLTAFRDIVEMTERTIPPDDSVYVFPGDGPFYFVTGRKCPVTNFQALRATGFREQAIFEQLRTKAVPWVVVQKTGFATATWPESFPHLAEQLEQQYEKIEDTPVWSLYRRRAFAIP